MPRLPLAYKGYVESIGPKEAYGVGFLVECELHIVTAYNDSSRYAVCDINFLDLKQVLGDNFMKDDIIDQGIFNLELRQDGSLSVVVGRRSIARVPISHTLTNNTVDNSRATLNATNTPLGFCYYTCDKVKIAIGSEYYIPTNDNRYVVLTQGGIFYTEGNNPNGRLAELCQLTIEDVLWELTPVDFNQSY